MYIWSTKLHCFELPFLVSIFIVIDLMTDFLYLSTGFVEIKNELASDVFWYDYLVCLSEKNIFLYITLLIPIFKISGAFCSLDDF